MKIYACEQVKKTWCEKPVLGTTQVVKTAEIGLEMGFLWLLQFFLHICLLDYCECLTAFYVILILLEKLKEIGKKCMS